VRIWLDDERPAPPDWHWARTVDEAIHMLGAGDVAEISLDYDLDYSDPGRDGMEVMEWLLEAADDGLEMPVVHFHTANPCGGALFADAWRELEGQHGLGWTDTHRLRMRLIAL